MLNRRNFIGKIVGGIATAAAIRTWPFRVYSFPSDVHASASDLFEKGILGRAVGFEFEDECLIGSTLTIRLPQRFVIEEATRFDLIYGFSALQPNVAGYANKILSRYNER
jgi:hypothetical protein